MSTRKKDVSNVREKRRTSPSPSHLKPTPKIISTSIPSSEKATPNYLKPTLSSSLSSGESRRRPFDKTPSPAPTMKTRGVSPSPARTRRTRGDSPVPSGKAVAGSLKGTREAGKQHLYARSVGTVKKSVATVASKSKKDETASLRRKDSSDHEESPIVGDEEDSVVTDQELGSSNEQTQGETDEDALEEYESHKADPRSEQPDADAAENNSSPAISEQGNATIVEAEIPTVCEESDDNVPKIESPAVSDQVEGNSSQQQEAEEHSAVETEIPTNPNEDKDRDEPTKIEEMTREQRRNKMRALAGAFENVISRQEHK